MALTWPTGRTVPPFNPHVNPGPALLYLAALLLLGATFRGWRAGQASHLSSCPLFPVFSLIETGSVEEPGCSPGDGEPGT